MAKLKSATSTLRAAWDEYGGWIIIIFFCYVLFSFRKVFSSAGDAVGETVQAAVANTQAAAQTKAEKAKVQQATGTKTNYTDAQLATFRADANSLAGYLGTLVGGGFRLFADDTSAFSLLKQKYPRLMLKNNKPFEWTGPAAKNGQRPMKNVTAETPNSVKSLVNYKVLLPYYKEVTGGRDMVSDVRSVLTSAKYQPTILWVL